MNFSSPASPKSQGLKISIIEKQRKELQLLIAELKDRDKELNDTVSLHQKQLLAWENDRQKILTLQQKCDRLESELQGRNNIIKSLTKRMQLLEGQQQDRRVTLESTQQQLQEISLIATETNSHCYDLEDKNQHLNESILELSAQVGRLQAREQELSTLLKLKDKDLIEATNHITEFTSRFKDIEVELHKAKRREISLTRQAQDLPPRLKGLKSEVAKLQDDLRQKIVESNEQREEIIRLKQESAYIQAEMVFAAERERRKDQLLHLAKSKQDRTNLELQNLQQVYMKQHHDLQFLHLTLESANDKAQAEMDARGVHCDWHCKGDRRLPPLLFSPLRLRSTCFNNTSHHLAADRSSEEAGDRHCLLLLDSDCGAKANSKIVKWATASYTSILWSLLKAGATKTSDPVSCLA